MHIIEILGKPTITLIWLLYLINESVLYAFVYKSTALEMQQSDVQRYNIHMIFIHCETLRKLTIFHIDYLYETNIFTFKNPL